MQLGSTDRNVNNILHDLSYVNQESIQGRISTHFLYYCCLFWGLTTKWLINTQYAKNNSQK
jgi:hypothetical protein